MRTKCEQTLKIYNSCDEQTIETINSMSIYIACNRCCDLMDASQFHRVKHFLWSGVYVSSLLFISDIVALFHREKY